MVRALFVLLCLFGIEANAAVGVVSFDPVTTTVDAGSTFSVDVVGTFDTDVLGGGLTLELNPQTGLAVKDVVFNPAWDLQIWTPGTLTAEFAVFVGAPPTGTFTILTFEFLAEAKGEYSLGLTQYAGNPFTDSSMSPIVVSFDPHNVPAQVTAVPEPAAAWMLVVGLALAAGVLCVRRASVL